MGREKEIKTYVRNAYGDLAQDTSACCSGPAENADMVEQALAMGYDVEEIKSVPPECLMGLGCGNPTALSDLKEGQTVLDLGSGTGLDVFLAAQKLGKTGKAIGVDMTESMAQRAHQAATRHGYTNARFILGEIECLPVEDASVDVIISNCVINLSPDKAATFNEIYRVLRPGGSAVVSDLVTVGELSSHLRMSFEAWAGCIAGALEKETYLSTIKSAGFGEVSLLSEQTFFELGLSKASGGRIESLQVKAYKT
jgi:SAM-dependent methyltransferase